MSRLVDNSPSIQITIFGNITSSLLESLGTNDVTSINNSGLISEDIFDQGTTVISNQNVATTIASDNTQVQVTTGETGTTQQIASILQQTEVININEAGQSYYQIITQQPNRFQKINVDIDGTPNSISSSKVILSWSYNNILVKNENVGGSDNYVKYANDSNNFSILPTIKKLYIDISSNAAAFQKQQWLNLQTIDVSYNYDIESLRNFTVNKFKEDTPLTDIDQILSYEDVRFDMRVYGSNDSLDFPSVDNRALVYKNCKFLVATKPSKPLYTNVAVVDNSSILVYYQVNETEIGSTDPDTKIDRYLLIYSEVDTLASNYANYSGGNQILTNQLPQTYGTNEDIEINLNNLRSGTKYDTIVQLRNNINKNEFSTTSDTVTTPFSKLPSSLPLYGIDVSLNIIGTKKFIRSKILNGSEVIFINIKDLESQINYETGDYQYIEISNPEKNDQEFDTYGYGKFIDDSNNLVKLEYHVNNVLKQEVIFTGFNMNLIENKKNGNNFSFFRFISKDDMYVENSDTKLRGFRIGGKFQLQSIKNDFENTIGPASSDAYKIKIEYTRDTLVTYRNEVKIFDVYIDNFNSFPTFFRNNINFDVKLITYNMGIPSVKAFSFIFDKGLININSINMFINGDGVIELIHPINNLSCDLSKSIILNNYELNSNGIYEFNNSSFQNKVNNYYSNVHYINSTITRNNSIIIDETLYNIYYPNGRNIQNSFTANHYCDYNSYNKDSENRINLSKLDLTLINIYQFQNIQVFNYDMLSLQYDLYSNHGSSVNDHTLLYIDGGFNSASIYPTINNYEFNNISFIVDPYNDANVSYNLNGFRLNNNNGYKWITFRIEKFNSHSFKFNNKNSKIINTQLKGLNEKGPRYIPFDNLNNFNESDTLFPSGIIDRLSDANDNNVIGFCILDDIYDVTKISLFNKKFSKNNNWMTHGTLKNNTAFLYLLTFQNENLNKWGSLVHDHERQQYGMYIDPNLVKDYIYISVGIKNNLVI
jgi:hypothetical protein